VKAVRSTPMSSSQNAFVERYVLSIKSECVGRLLPLRKGRLRQAIWDYIAHYYDEQGEQDPEQSPNRWGGA